jgi:hypothetical protein
MATLHPIPPILKPKMDGRYGATLAASRWLEHRQLRADSGQSRGHDRSGGFSILRYDETGAQRLGDLQWSYPGLQGALGRLVYREVIIAEHARCPHHSVKIGFGTVQLPVVT